MSSDQTPALRARDTYYYYLQTGRAARLALGFMLLSLVLRAVWWAVWPEDAAAAGVLAQAVLPLAADGLFCLCLLAPRRIALRASFLPAAMGVLFFIIKAAEFTPWHRLLCTLLYLLVAALYGLTTFSVLPLRKLLFPLFGIPLAYHILVEDLILYRTVYTWPQWVQEWSVLCIMAGLLSVAFAIRKAPKGEAP